MDFVVDKWGNCWASDDEERRYPVLAHPELDTDKASCPSCGRFVYRVQRQDQSFEWRCGCGRTFPGLHH